MGVQSPSTLPTLCPFLKDTNCKVPATGMTLEKKPFSSFVTEMIPKHILNIPRG